MSNFTDKLTCFFKGHTMVIVRLPQDGIDYFVIFCDRCNHEYILDEHGNPQWRPMHTKIGGGDIS